MTDIIEEEIIETRKVNGKLDSRTERKLLRIESGQVYANLHKDGTVLLSQKEGMGGWFAPKHIADLKKVVGKL